MSTIELAEGIYVKKSKSKIGSGGTSRESVAETLWLPFNIEDGYVELYPVMDDLARILKLSEKVSIEEFSRDYSVKENSGTIYQKLMELV